VPSAGFDDVEANAEPAVAERTGWAPAAVLAEYEEWSVKGIDALGGLQAQPVGETVVPLANLGSHPLHLLADALVFDHYCHLRKDVLRPNGPVDRPAPPQEDATLRAVTTWMFAGLPQMNAAALAPVLSDPVRFALEGPGGGTWTLLPAHGDHPIRVRELGSDVRATVHSTADDFVVWGTARRPWRECRVRLEGDEDYAAAVLAAVNII
jgi:hypothetical protein